MLTSAIFSDLIDFQIVSRSGDRPVLPYEKEGLKDVVWLGRGETVRVLAKYAPWDGVYMFHCHNLIHEDHDMMAALNVTALQNFGYQEKTSFIDPMEARWRSKPINAADFEAQAIQSRLAEFSELDAYRNAREVEAALDDYRKTRAAAPSTLVTSIQSSSAAAVTSAAATSAAASSAAAATSASVSSASTTTRAATTAVTLAASTLRTSTTSARTSSTTTSKTTTSSKTTTTRSTTTTKR